MFDRSSTSVTVPSLTALLAASDLLAACLLALVGTPIMLLAASPLVRTAVAVPALLFAPGYALVVAIYPSASSVPVASDNAVESGGDDRSGRFRSVSLLDRIVLSILLSALLVPAVAVVVGSLFSISPVPVLIGVGLVTIALGLVAVRRRTALPPERQFHPSTTPAWERLVAAVHTPSGIVLAASVSICVLLAGASAGVAFGQTGDPVTEFYVVGQNNGTSQIGVYDDAVLANGTINHTLAVEHEGSGGGTYTVVARLADANATAPGAGSVIATRTVEVPPGRSARTTVSLALSTPGDRRITYLLYEGSPPANPTRENALRAVWVSITVVR
ncbi:MAG: DUF1616 domain-containing protein [Haloarculaceae archaeon]